MFHPVNITVIVPVLRSYNVCVRDMVVGWWYWWLNIDVVTVMITSKVTG